MLLYYLLCVLMLILSYELAGKLCRELFVNRNNKYFCEQLSQDIILSQPQRRIISFCDYVIEVSSNKFYLLLDNTIIASWEFTDKVSNLVIDNECVFETFKKFYKVNR